MHNGRRITSIFREEILSMSAYKVADASGLIKLDAMENPYGWPDPLKFQWLEKLKDCQLNRYPDPEARRLVEVLKKTYAIPKQFDVLLGNGSDEIILILLMALPAGTSVLAPEPSFVMYKQLSISLGLRYWSVALLKDSFELNVPDMLAVIEEKSPEIIFLAYPNNPTGNLFDSQSIRSLISASQGLVVIDEAYLPFAGTSFIDALQEFDNLLVMRTVSKLGLAGLRLGYLIGSKDIIQELNKIRLPYNINSLTQISADFALTNKAMFDQQIHEICSEREALCNRMQALGGITVYPSAANFILFKCPEHKANQIFQEIKQQGVLIKNVHPQGGLLTDCLRVTIGTPEENRAFLIALQNSLSLLNGQ